MGIVRETYHKGVPTIWGPLKIPLALSDLFDWCEPPPLVSLAWLVDNSCLFGPSERIFVSFYPSLLSAPWGHSGF